MDAVTVGAALYLLWGVLHLWVPADGLHHYFTQGVRGQWTSVVGGARVPLAQFEFPKNKATAHAHSMLLNNFSLDVGGYGILGIVVAWMLYSGTAVWTAAFLGLVVIGTADLAFLFCLVYPGQVIKLSFPVILGPLLWFLANGFVFAGLLA